MVYREVLVRFRVDSDDIDAVTFLRAYNRLLKDRFKQLDMWITALVIEII